MRWAWVWETGLTVLCYQGFLGWRPTEARQEGASESDFCVLEVKVQWEDKGKS